MAQPAPTPSQIKAELTLDPKQRGYAALIATAGQTGDWDAVAARLNSTYAGVGVVWRSAIPNQDLLACVAKTEFSGLTQLLATKLQTVLTPRMIDGSSQNVRDMFAVIFPTAGSVTLAAMAALAQIAAPTRAQELWGDTNTGVDGQACAVALAS